MFFFRRRGMIHCAFARFLYTMNIDTRPPSPKTKRCVEGHLRHGDRRTHGRQLSAPGFDDRFDLWAGPVFAMLESCVGAIQAEEIVGVVCFHPKCEFLLRSGLEKLP